MGDAARLSLKALGKQDLHLLSDDTEDLLFNYKERRHSDFRKYHRTKVVPNDGTSQSWPFGKTIKVQFNPQNMGDLLSNMWLSVKMPANPRWTYDVTTTQYTVNSGLGLYGAPTTGTTPSVNLTPVALGGGDIVWEPYDLETSGYGTSVAISKEGTYMAVGAPGELRIYVYVLFQGVWFYESTIETPETLTFNENDSTGNAQMGMNVAINNGGTRVATGTWYYTDGADPIELRLYIFNKSTTGDWSNVITQYEPYVVLQNVPEPESPGIPTSLSMNGDGTKLAVGFSGKKNPSFGSNRLPKVYVYDIDNTGITATTDYGEIGESDDNVVSMSDDGNVLVVGAKGVVRLYGSGTTGIDLIPNGYSVTVDYGHAVSINSGGTYIAVSDLVNVYIFNTDGVHEYTIPGSATGTQKFGCSLAFNAAANRLVIGQSSVTLRDPTPPPQTSTAYIYVLSYESDTWELEGTVSGTTDLHGFVVACDDVGDTIITGEPSNNSIDITNFTYNQSFNFADQLGRHIFKSVTMRVDELEVEKIYDDWCVIYDELYLEMSEKVANQMLVNRNLNYDSSYENAQVASYELDLMIPIPFFFSRKYASDEHSTNKPNRPYFPLCAIHKQKVEFEFEFHNQSFFTNNTTPISLDNFVIITEEITVSPEERRYLVSQPQLLITDVVKKHPEEVSEVGRDTIRMNLVPNIPVKCFHWFFRNINYE